MTNEFDDDMPDFFEDYIMDKDGKLISIEVYRDQQAKAEKRRKQAEPKKTRKNKNKKK